MKGFVSIYIRKGRGTVGVLETVLRVGHRRTVTQRESHTYDREEGGE